ncbi:MAG: type II toxin-antitoxin system death-on-curing family toxin [Verrucomicrobiaceae bacterium]
MSEFKHHTVSSDLALHDEVLAANGGLSGVKDLGLLESAIAAPQASFGGQAMITDVIEVAAAYLFHVCQNHPFNDGNKRTALAAALVFLVENGKLAADVELDCDAWETLVLDVAASRIGKAELGERLRGLLG